MALRLNIYKNLMELIWFIETQIKRFRFTNQNLNNKREVDSNKKRN